MFPRSEGLKAITEDYHRFRQEARENAFSINEFSRDEQIRYDLETAGITGRGNPETFTYKPELDLLGIEGRLVTELPRHE